MSAITTIPYFFEAIYPGLIIAAEAITKVGMFARQYFSLGSCFCLTGWGGKEIFIDKTRIRHQTTTNQTITTRTTSGLNWFFEKIRLYSNSQADRIRHIAHGFLFFSSGVAGIASQIHTLELANLGIAGPVFAVASNSFFLGANCVGLETNIRNVLKAKKILDSNQLQNREAALELLKTSLLGIASNLSYITFSALTLLGQTGAIVLLIAAFGCLFGCLKILYDLKMEHRLTE